MKELTKSTNVFANNGDVKGYGYARKPNIIFNKDKSTASYFRTKQADSYYILNEDMALFLSIEDAGLFGTVSAVLWDLKNHGQYSRTVQKLFPYFSFTLPSDVNFGDTSYTDNRVGMKFSKSGNVRNVRADFIDFVNSKNLYLNITLKEQAEDSMNVALPFSNSRTSFFVKSFIPHMKAEGVIRCGGLEFNLKENESIGNLMWTRTSTAERCNCDTLYCFGKTNGAYVTLMLSNNVQGAKDSCMNCIFVNGKMMTLPRVKKKYNKEEKCYEYIGENGYLKINFIPTTTGGILLEADCNNKRISQGTVFGQLTINNTKIMIDDFHGMIESLNI